MKRLLTALILFPASFAYAEEEPAKDGAAIVAEASGKLIAALTAAIAKDGPAGAIGVCSEKAPEIAELVGKAHGVTLGRMTEKPRNPFNAAGEAGKEILAAFALDMKNGKPPAARSITNTKGETTFVAPIVIPGPLCLQCHGDPANDIAPQTLTAIRKLYPEDRATGYKTGDLRGAWAVTFDPKQ
jgi:hypothetical protein